MGRHEGKGQRQDGKGGNRGQGHEMTIVQTGWDEHPAGCACRRCRRRAVALARRQKPRYGQAR
jgi:hypothetical protein